MWLPSFHSSPSHPRRHLQAALLFVALVGLLPALAGCDDAPSTTQPKGVARLVNIQIGKGTFACEIADDARSREFGLMFRKSMPANRGMLFIFGDEQVREFWMKNTFIPLDIVFLDHTGKVVAIRTMQPQDENTTSSDLPALYAIELNAGAAARAGVKEGDTITIPPIPPQQ